MKKAIITRVKWDVASQVWQYFHEGNHRETEHFLVYILVRNIRESHVGVFKLRSGALLLRTNSESEAVVSPGHLGMVQNSKFSGIIAN